MSDGKYFLKKVQDLLKADTALQALATGGIAVEIADFSPVGNTYPQISIELDEGNSEPVFPAGHHTLTVTLSVEKSKSEPYKMIRKMCQRVNAVLNRKASSLSEITVLTNTGLRVAKCLKTGGGIWFDASTGLYNDELMYDCVISENEDFSSATAGDKTWV